MGLKYHKCPTFDGQADTFLAWYLKFSGFAYHQGFKRAISTEIDPRMPSREDAPRSTDPTTADEEEAAMAENNARYAHLTYCLTANRDLVYVRRGVTEAWPNGTASMVIKHMFNRYKPDDATAMAECASRLLRLRLGPSANPADLFTKIADIQAQYESANYTIDQPMIVSTVLRAAPIQYKSVITALQVARGNAMTVSDLEDAMDLYHRNVINVAKPTGRNETTVGDDGEVALSGFSGACYKCGEMGHAKANCPKKVVSKKASKNKIPRRKCETCGKEHAGPCWEDDANAHLRPANWKSAKATGGNIAATAVEQAGTEGEYVLSGIAGMDWKKTIMPSVVLKTEDIEENSVQKVIVDDVIEGIIHYDKHWFPYEWFLDSDSTPAVADVSVPTAEPVMKDHNKNRKSQFQLVDQIANGYLLEHELGLKITEKVGKEITFPNVRAMLSDPDFFIADSGATTHATASLKGMRNLQMGEKGDCIEMASGAKEAAIQVGDLPGILCDQHGHALQNVVLHDVTYAPSFKFNLFSTSKLQREGWTMTGNYDSITMTKGGMTVCFDIVIPTDKGAIYCLYLKRGFEMVNMAAQTEKPKLTMTIKQAHERFGHIGEDETRAMAKHLGIKVTQGKLKPCEGCTVAKAKQKNVPQINLTQVRATRFGERVYSDISTIRQSDDGPPVTKPNWHMIIDEATRLMTCNFYSSKNGMVEPTCELFHQWKIQGRPVEILRQDNAGENKLLQNRSNSAAWKLGIKFEYTARDTPQQNHLVELAFATVINKSRAMMASANIPYETRFKLWKEAIKTAVNLDGLRLRTIEGATKTKYEHAYGSNPKFANHLRTWGEAGTVKTKVTGTPKLMNRGAVCIFIGYAKDHEGDCYLMWNPLTNGVHTTRDIIWLRRMYYSKDIGFNVTVEPMVLDEPMPDDIVPDQIETVPGLPPGGDDVDDVSVGGETTPMANLQPLDDADEDDDAPEVRTMSGRVVRPPSRLIAEMGNLATQGHNSAINYEISLSQPEYNFYSVMTQLDGDVGELACMASVKGMEFALVGAALGGGFEDTTQLHVMNYEEAMASDDHDNWMKAMKEEHDRMVAMGVWKAVPPSAVPPNETILTTTWTRLPMHVWSRIGLSRSMAFNLSISKFQNPGRRSAVCVRGWYGAVLPVTAIFS
jgi:hypothetical protein